MDPRAEAEDEHDEGQTVRSSPSSVPVSAGSGPWRSPTAGLMSVVRT